METRNSGAEPGCGRSLAMGLAEWVAAVGQSDVPEEAIAKAQLHALDSLGLALASHAEAFAGPSLEGVSQAGSRGECSVIGAALRLAPRDAAMINGLLMHGLDFDDTHPASIIHASVASLPAALALGEHLDADWDEVLRAYVLGMEAAIRIGASVQGGFHHVGFHATGVVSHFSAALVAGKLLSLNAEGLTAAQGIAVSTASGVQVFLEEGAWTKRMHPGWGALSGITAAHMAKAGFVAPSRPYEGKFGLYDTHLHGTEPLPEKIIDGLGRDWHMLETAIKPYPICHFNHGCVEAAINLHAQLADRIGDIEEVVAWLAEPTLHIVAEPAEAKQNVSTDYEAKFSVQYGVAVGLLKGCFGLKELGQATIQDETVRRLTRKVECRVDPQTRFPVSFSGGVTVRLRDGTELKEHIPVNKGAGTRAMSSADIMEKFQANAGTLVDAARSERMMQAVLEGRGRSVREVMREFRL